MDKLLLATAIVLSRTSAFAATSEEYQCTIKGDAMIQTLPNDDGREITYADKHLRYNIWDHSGEDWVFIIGGNYSGWIPRKNVGHCYGKSGKE
jgi:hypothetical protein